MTEQLYMVWDWKRNEAHSMTNNSDAAYREAERLNAMQAMDWNGLPRYQAMEDAGR